MYYQFCRKGFRKGFALHTILYTVLFGDCLVGLFVSGYGFRYFSLTIWTIYIFRCWAILIIFPVFEQVKLMSNYDIKKLGSKKL